VAVLTLLAMTSCSTIRLLKPSELDSPKSAPDTLKTARSLKPGHWYVLRSYVDQKGEVQSVTGRVRAVAGDSLEFDSYSSSTWSLSTQSHRSIVPRDSVRLLDVSEFNARETVLVVVVVATVVTVFVVQLGRVPGWVWAGLWLP
jgi:hypothetical protein